MRSEAYAILGTLDFNAKAWASAEENLKKSIEALPQQPDPIAVFRLSVALDMQNKYPDALKYADQAVALTKAGTNAGDAARKEKDRLGQLIPFRFRSRRPAPSGRPARLKPVLLLALIALRIRSRRAPETVLSRHDWVRDLIAVSS